MPTGSTRRPLLPRSWRLLAAAVAVAGLLVWGLQRISFARDLGQFQEQVDHSAGHLSDGRKKALVLGSMITLGRLSPVVRATADRTLPPDNPAVLGLLKRLTEQFELTELLVVDREGVIAAYYISSGMSGVGRSLAFRPYIKAAVAGIPNMYAAVGSVNGERGFYVATPIQDPEVAGARPSQALAPRPPAAEAAPPLTGVIGVVVAKLGFEEVDQLLEKEPTPLAVVSPEGVVFASNVAAWRFRALGTRPDLGAVRQDRRTSKAFEKEPPRALEVDGSGWIKEGGRSLKLVSAVIDWRDPEGAWRLVGFVDPLRGFGVLEQLIVGAMGFLFVVLLGGWWQARRREAERAAELHEANRKLAVLSITDGLTGLANRRRFDDVLAEEWLRASRHARPLALLMIDVDHFKKFNDHYGHQAGDECLKSIAGVLQSCARRAGDLAARYGGEEFALVLADTGAEAAQGLAESIRVSIEKLGTPHVLSPSGVVTVSIGAAAMAPGPNQVAVPLLHSADMALYRAKTDGRNRVVLAPAAPPPGPATP